MIGIAKNVTIKILLDEENAIDVNLRKLLIVNLAILPSHQFVLLKNNLLKIVV